MFFRAIKIENCNCLTCLLIRNLNHADGCHILGIHASMYIMHLYKNTLSHSSGVKQLYMWISKQDLNNITMITSYNVEKEKSIYN